MLDEDRKETLLGGSRLYRNILGHCMDFVFTVKNMGTHRKYLSRGMSLLGW